MDRKGDLEPVHKKDLISRPVLELDQGVNATVKAVKTRGDIKLLTTRAVVDCLSPTDLGPQRSGSFGTQLPKNGHSLSCLFSVTFLIRRKGIGRIIRLLSINYKREFYYTLFLVSKDK